MMAAKKPQSKTAVTKKVAVKKPAAKKPAAAKVATKQIAEKKAVAKKPTAKPAAKAPVKRSVTAKVAPEKLKPANNKTNATKANVADFIASVAEHQREDTAKLVKLMSKITKQPAEMWGSSIVGFGHRTLTYETGRTMDWMWVAFSPRKQNMTVYILDGFPRYAELLAKLGKHSTGKSCLYIKSLADVNVDVLHELIAQSVARIKATL
jgi:hypothetical protein